MKRKTTKNELTEIKRSVETLKALILEDLRKNRELSAVKNQNDLLDEYLNGAKNDG